MPATLQTRPRTPQNPEHAAGAGRDPRALLEQARRQWGGQRDLWVFAYGSLIWRPEFSFEEQRPARVHGWHRALRMWSRINRGTPECPGLVFGMLSGGSCQGLVFRIAHHEADSALQRLWQREMITGVYDPRWLRCHTPQGPVSALAFTLSRRSPSHTGELSEADYRRIFSQACGQAGTTLDYARQTHEQLLRLGIEDRSLAQLLRLAPQGKPSARHGAR